MRRRTVLLGTVGTVAGLAGCSSLTGSSRTLDVVVYSHAEDPYTVWMTVFRDGSTRSDARIADGTFEVSPGDSATRENFVESRRFLVRYSVYRNDSTLTDEGHHHYFPPDGDPDNLAFDIDAEGTLTRR